MEGEGKYIVYYCKSRKKTGKPIVISDGKEEVYTHRLDLEGIDGSMVFQNTKGRAKKRGATTCLQLEGVLVEKEDGSYRIRRQGYDSRRR